MKLKDIEITRYSSFANHTVSQNQEILWQKFADVLKTSVKTLSKDGKSDGFENTIEKKLTKRFAKKGYFIRIIKSGTNENSYIKFDDFERKLESGIFLDVYLLNESVYKKGEPEMDLNNLKGLLPKHTQIESKLPTDCYCYFVESKKPEADKKEIFTKLLDWDFEEQFEVDLGHSFFAINLLDENAVAVVIPRDIEKTPKHDSATKLYGEILQEYFLSYAKVAHEIASIKKLKAKEAGEVLICFLGWLEERPRTKTLSQIEYANHQLSTYRADLAVKINRIEIHIHTIEINMGNAVKVLNYEILKTKKDELNQVLIKPLQYELDQIKTDLSYLKLYDEKAKIQGEEITNLSNLQAGIYGRKLAYYFGFLSLIGILQFFKGVENWQDTTKILIFVAIILIPVLILFGRDIINLLFGIDRFEQPDQNNQTLS